jgi:hypothetical protein
MGHIITGADRKDIHADWWDDGETVTIKRFSYVDELFIATHSTVGEPEMDDFGDMRVRIDRSLWVEARLMRGIVAWTLEGEDGEALPCSDGNKARLNDRDGRFIHSAIADLNRERSEQDQASFRD